MNNQPEQYIPHDCFNWRTIHHHLSENYTYETCGYCDKIIGFRYKSFWKRLKEAFYSKIKQNN
jgi:hypothetical protein